jgi:hypothetical protein
MRGLLRPLAAAAGMALLLGLVTVQVSLEPSVSAASWLYQRVSVVLHTTSPTQVVVGEDGVPRVNRGYKDGAYVGEKEHPMLVASVAREYLSRYEETGNQESYVKFMNCMGWLESSAVRRDGGVLWPYNYGTSYVPEPPFYSALAQANIMRALYEAYVVTHEERYRALIDGVLVSLDTAIPDGGCMVRVGGGSGKWFAEVAAPCRSKPPFILNGHMEVLLRLHEYSVATGNEPAARLFDEGVVALMELLPQYDAGRWSYYDLEGNWADDYHYTHIEELRQLHDITGKPLLAEYADRWDSYVPWNPMWARKRFAAYLLNVAVLFCVLACCYLAWRLVRSRKVRA